MPTPRIIWICIGPLVLFSIARILPKSLGNLAYL